MDRWDANAIIELVTYLKNNSIAERQDNFLVYNPKALRFWIVPVKESAEENLKMFEGGMSLRKMFGGNKYE